MAVPAAKGSPPPPHTHLHVVKELVGCLGTVAGEHVGAQAVNGPGGGMKAGLLERPARGTALHAFTPPYHFMPFDASNPGACFWIATLVRCM